MAVTAPGFGTQLAVVTTEHTLYEVPAAAAAAGTFTLHVDTVNMVAGDVLELRVYQMILTGGTRRVAYVVRYEGAQLADEMIKISVPISNELITDVGALRFTLTQTFGTGRNFPWKVLKYA